MEQKKSKEPERASPYDWFLEQCREAIIELTTAIVKGQGVHLAKAKLEVLSTFLLKVKMPSMEAEDFKDKLLTIRLGCPSDYGDKNFRNDFFPQEIIRAIE